MVDHPGLSVLFHIADFLLLLLSIDQSLQRNKVGLLGLLRLQKRLVFLYLLSHLKEV